MPVIADVHISHPELVLEPTVRRVPDAEIRVVSNSATDPETRVFSYLVRTDDYEAFEVALDDDPTVDGWQLHATFESARVYQITYGKDIKLISTKATEVGGLILEAVGTGDGWRVQLQLPDREALAALHEYCQQEEMDLSFNNVYSDEAVRLSGATGVTEAQREALLSAYDGGYFKQPRDMSLDDLAEELDISSTAAGGRLRRGMENLVETTLVEE